jgi:DNA helicase-2/ATP-dependent DNA helicase PcrA
MMGGMSDDARRRLGRGVIVPAGGAVPEGWGDAPRVPVDHGVLRDPAAVVGELHGRWAAREPVVVDLGVDVNDLRAPETETRPPYELTPAFEFPREHLYFLARANNYDARSGRLVWGPAIEAARLGAQQGGPFDVTLPDGTPAWVDGGPRVGAIAGVDGAVVHRVRVEHGDLTPDTDAAVDADLAPDQLAAVAHRGGPARIIAPAGSGKTRVLTERFRLLVDRRGWGPSAVCAVAYNVRAKDEMAGRLADVGTRAVRKVRTLHALGFDAVRRSRDIRDVLTEWDVRRRIEPLVPVRPRANTDVLAPYLEALAEVRLGLVPPEIVESRRDDVDGFAAMFERFRRALHAEAVMDHDEQIYGALEVLLTDVGVRRELQAECRHLLVDEFQDLTPAQLLMLRLLAAPAYDTFGVGDDDQVVYGYSGADPAFLIDYDTYFPGAAHLQLEVNYRCPADVVNAASNLLSYNRVRVPKRIRAAKPEGPPAHPIGRHRAEDTAAAAVARVQEWLEAGARPGAIAVLSRVRAVLLGVQLLCAQHNIPANAPIGEEVLERTGTRTALAYLRLALGASADAFGGADLAVACRRPSRSVRREVLQRIGARRRWTMAALRHVADDAKTGRFDEFLDDLELLGRKGRAGADTETLLRAIRDDVGLGGALATLDRGGRGPEASHRDDLNALLAVASLAPDLAAFEPWLRSMLDRPRADATADEVTLSTVHRVKGMEWPYVVVLGVHDGLMPHHLADDVEEERRIFHVALTRADTEVHLLAESSVRTPFLDELEREAPPRPVAAAARAPAAKRGGDGFLATVGLELTYAGSTGPIVELRAQVAVIGAHDGGQVLVPYGERVEVEGRRAPLVAPASPALAPADARLLEALKDWRRDRARADGVPAYVVLHDRHLEGIAAARPTSLVRLGRCDGIGPTKLERYGDEIVAVVVAAAGLPPV